MCVVMEGLLFGSACKQRAEACFLQVWLCKLPPSLSFFSFVLADDLGCGWAASRHFLLSGFRDKDRLFPLTKFYFLLSWHVFDKLALAFYMPHCPFPMNWLPSFCHSLARCHLPIEEILLPSHHHPFGTRRARTAVMTTEQQKDCSALILLSLKTEAIKGNTTPLELCGIGNILDLFFY